MSTPVRLTQRETQVLWLLGHGLARERIAERLKIAPQSVARYARRARRKLAGRTPC